MKRWFKIFMFLLFASGCQMQVKSPFETYLGPAKGSVLRDAKNQFCQFLDQNFAGENRTDQTIQFLNYVHADTVCTNLIRFNAANANTLLTNYESTRLRHDFMLLGLEAYDSLFKYDLATGQQSVAHTSTLESLELELADEAQDQAWDSTYISWLEERIAEFEREAATHYHPNKFGRYQFGLKKFYGQDQFVKAYLQAYEHEVVELPSAEVTSNFVEALEGGEMTEGAMLVIIFEVFLPYLHTELNILGLHTLNVSVE